VACSKQPWIACNKGKILIISSSWGLRQEPDLAYSVPTRPIRERRKQTRGKFEERSGSPSPWLLCRLCLLTYLHTPPGPCSVLGSSTRCPSLTACCCRRRPLSFSSACTLQAGSSFEGVMEAQYEADGLARDLADFQDQGKPKVSS
jgi:hypothetical protein